MDAKTRELLLSRLRAAEEAQHDMAIGSSAKVFVDQNGERIEYNTMSPTALTKYIFTLRSQLGMVVSGPAYPWM